MTRAYFDKKGLQLRLKEVLEEKERIPRAKEIMEKWCNYRDYDAFRMAARLIRYFRKDIMVFKKDLEAAANDCMLQNIGFSFDNLFLNAPMMIRDPSNLENVIVFPNIPISKYDEKYMAVVSDFIAVDILEEFHKAYLEDKKGEFFHKKWNSRSAWKRIKQFNIMSLPTAMMRFTRAKDYLKDNQIRDIGTAFVDMKKEIELFYINDPKDAYSMYGSGPSSCMDPRTHGDAVWAAFKNAGMHPTSFLIYHPYIKGVYMKAGGNVAARTFLYTYDNDSVYYGRVYSANDRVKAKFIEALYKLKYKHLSDLYLRNAEFKIPGIKVNSDYFMPFPYLDNLYNGVNAKFDDKTNEFTISCGRDVHSNVKIGAQGWVAASSLKNNITCAACTGLCQGSRFIMPDGKIVCSQICAGNLGFVLARRYNADSVWVAKENTVRDAVNGSCYTNLDNAVKSGLLPILMEDLHEAEEDKITREGYTVKFKQRFFKWLGQVDKLPKALPKTSSMYGAYFLIVGEEYEKEIDVAWQITVKKQRVVELKEEDSFITMVD